MPVMDGRDATRAIRAFEQVHSLRRLPIVAVTASTMQDDVDACYECGMDDHIAKVFFDFGMIVSNCRSHSRKTESFLQSEIKF